MKLGLLLGYSGKKLELPMTLVKQAEEIGFDSVWVAEAYGSDAVSVSAWILAQTGKIRVGTAIMQIPARTPANAAMTAMSLAQLSGGRFILGLGASGPQVVEGWHGMPYGKPMTRTREYIQIVRKIMAREEPAALDGELYQLPFRGEGSVGLGKPLKSILYADTTIPIYTASFTPGGFRLSAELADGAIPAFASPDKLDIITDHVAEGFAKNGTGKSFKDFDIAPFVNVCMGDDINACREKSRHMLALYVGGMGARNKNFYNDFAKKLGYGDAAAKIQDLYLAGDKMAAAAEVPNEFIDEVSLVGSRDQIQKQADKWRAARDADYVKTMILAVDQLEVLPVLAEVFAT
ncbi:MAG: LLM class F420-dependent oxidoreductase [Pseudomonadales bacterium]